MATIKPTVTGDQIMTADKSVLLVVWTGVTSADDFGPIEFPDYPDRCVQVGGTFDGSTVIVQGSNDGSAWAGLNHIQGSAITGTSAYLKQIAETPRYTRPSASGGGGSQSLTVTMILRKSNPMRT